MQSFEPVLLVYIDLKTKKAYYRWINEALIEELNSNNEQWIAQDSVSIVFNKTQNICKETLSSIEHEVLKWKWTAKSLLSPGNYSHYSTEAHNFCKRLQDCLQKHHVPFLSQEVDNVCKNMANAIFTVAVIGLRGAGKSTLINALMRKEISPMGKLPTTGVPITIFPKNENRTYVHFLDKNREIVQGESTSAFIGKYTTQERNPDNKEGIRLVHVNVINKLLERGFAICDVPGLDDADPAIRNIATTAIYNANAIIYVISVASYDSGEFRINDKNVEDLNRIKGRMERVFLVFNKADKLNGQDIEPLKKYIDDTLKKFGIYDFIAAPPIFISSKEAFEKRIVDEPGTDTVLELEQILWQYLINQNKTGLNRLLSNFANTKELIDRIKNLIDTRLQNSSERQRIESDISHVKREVSNLQAFIAEKREGIYTQVKEYVVDRFNNIIEQMNADLQRRQTPQSLPNKTQIAEFLEAEAHTTISDVYEYLQQERFQLQGEVNGWINEKLKQVQLTIDEVSAEQDFKMPEISKYTSQVYAYFNDSGNNYWGILETIVGKIAEAIAWLFAQFDRLFTSDIVVKNRQINKALGLARRSYNQIQTDLLKNVSEYLNGICNTITKQTLDRTNVYLGEQQKLAKELDTPLSANERQRFDLVKQELAEIEQDIASQCNDLWTYMQGIDWLKTKAIAHS